MTDFVSTEIQEQFGSAAPAWLLQFAKQPLGELDRLVRNESYLGSLNVAEPDDLLTDWAAAFDSRSKFASRLDAALSEWITIHWGNLAQDQTDLSLPWQRILNVVGDVPYAEQAAATLRGRWREAKAFLGALSLSPSHDPLGRYFRAMATHQVDDSLLHDWWQICRLAGTTAYYHGPYGVLGIRRIPRPSGTSGGFPTEAASAILRYGVALDQRVDRQVVPANTARRSFLATARTTIAAYPFYRRWSQVFIAVSQGGPRMQAWVDILLDDLGTPEKSASKQRRKARKLPQPGVGWARQAKELAASLKGGDSRLYEAGGLLEEQRVYARQTGDTEYLVRSLCNFSTSVLTTHSHLANSWSKEASRWEPDNPYGWTLNARALLALGRLDEALYVAWMASQRFPDNSYVRNLLGFVLRESGRVDDAAEIFQEAADAFEQDSEAYGVSIRALYSTLLLNEDLSWAEQVLQQLTTDFPDEAAAAHQALGLSFFRQERFSEAADAYRRATELDPGKVSGWSRLGEALLRQEQFSEAADAYRRATELSPSNRWAWSRLGEALLRQEQFSEAADAYRRATELSPSNRWAWSRLGEALFKGKNYTDAVAVLRQGRSVDPDSAWILGRLGETLWILRQTDEARQTFEEGVTRHPHSLYFYRMLGGVLEYEGHFDRAEAAYRSGLSFEPDNVPLSKALAELLEARERRSSDDLDSPASSPDVGVRKQDDKLEREEVIGAESTEAHPLVASQEDSEDLGKEPTPLDDDEVERGGDEPEQHDDEESAWGIDLASILGVERREQSGPGEIPEGTAGRPEEPDEDEDLASTSRQLLEGAIRDAKLARRRAIRSREVDPAAAEAALSGAVSTLQGLLAEYPYEQRVVMECARQLILLDRPAEAEALLVRTLSSLPAAVGLESTLGRARLDDVRSGELYTPERFEEIVGPWTRAAAIVPEMRPLASFASVRACAALNDGSALQDRTAQALQILKRVTESSEDFGNLGAWWGGRAKRLVLQGISDDEIAEADVHLVKARLSDEASQVDALEEDFVDSLVSQGT